MSKSSRGCSKISKTNCFPMVWICSMIKNSWVKYKKTWRRSLKNRFIWTFRRIWILSRTSKILWRKMALHRSMKEVLIIRRKILTVRLKIGTILRGDLSWSRPTKGLKSSLNFSMRRKTYSTLTSWTILCSMEIKHQKKEVSWGNLPKKLRLYSRMNIRRKNSRGENIRFSNR